MRKLNVGIDLALVGQHRASVYDPQATQFLDNSFSFDTDYEGYEYLLKRVYRCVAKEEETEIHFIMEPTGLAWMPLSCFLVTRGHIVYRVSTQKSSDFRKFLNKHTKTDKVDTRALAVLPEMDSKGIYRLYLPTADLGTLSRKSKHMAKLTKEASMHKLRIQSICRMLNPNVLKAFGEEKFSVPARTLYRHFANPFKIGTMRQEGFFEGFRKLQGTDVSNEVLEKIYQASVSAVKIYEPMVENGTLPFEFQQVDEEIQTELRILEFIEAEISQIQGTVDVYYKKVDNEGALKSIRGIGDKIAPAILGMIGDVSRFLNIDKFRRFFGFTPKKNQSSNHEKKGQKINKAAQKLLKEYLYMAAEVARQWDPEFAAFYDRLTKKGFHHYAAICALANKMAGRVYAVLKRMQRSETSNYTSSIPVASPEQLKSEEVAYQVRDLDGNVVTNKEAREIVQEQFPSKSQRKKQDAHAKKQDRTKTKKESMQAENNTEKQRESLPSHQLLSEQTRQLFGQLPENSSVRSGKTLPAKDILDNMMHGRFLQDEANDSGKGTLIDVLIKLKKQIEENEQETVDNRYESGGKKMQKKA